MSSFIRDAEHRAPGVIGKLQCVGCGTIEKNVGKLSGYFTKCRCGSIIMSEDGIISFPELFVNTLADGGKQESVEFFIGYSPFMDERKKEIIEQLEAGGCKHVTADPSRVQELKAHLAASYMDTYPETERLRLAAKFALPYVTVRELTKRSPAV